MFLMTETIKLCRDGNEMMFRYANDKVILIRTLRISKFRKMLYYSEVAQN